ncbi:MAG TPA: hypothetical protein VGD78_01335 [Chthoniobacterales bacterium]
MGDKSPKEVHKKAVQKHLKDEAQQHEKQEVTVALHHPTSGHTPTPAHPTASDDPAAAPQKD